MKETPHQRRARENAALVARMKAGESLSLVAPASTWWPPRPLIKKDELEVARVLGEEKIRSLFEREVPI